MKYREMIKFLNDNNICLMQPIIADYVNTQLEVDISDDEYEDVCAKIFETYLDCIEEPDVWYLVDEELIKRGYKER